MLNPIFRTLIKHNILLSSFHENLIGGYIDIEIVNDYIETNIMHDQISRIILIFILWETHVGTQVLQMQNTKNLICMSHCNTIHNWNLNVNHYTIIYGLDFRTTIHNHAKTITRFTVNSIDDESGEASHTKAKVILTVLFYSGTCINQNTALES